YTYACEESFPMPLHCRAKFSDRALPSDSNSFVFIDPRERRQQPQIGESQISLFGRCNFPSARALLGVAPVVYLGVRNTGAASSRPKLRPNSVPRGPSSSARLHSRSQLDCQTQT